MQVGQGQVHIGRRRGAASGLREPEKTDLEKEQGKGICSFVTVTPWEIHSKKAQKVQGPEVRVSFSQMSSVHCMWPKKSHIMLNQTGGKGEKTLFVVYPEDRSSGWCQKGSTVPRAWQGMSFHKHTQHHGDPNQVWGFETRSRRAGWREREGGTQGTAGAQALQERCAKACPQPGPALEGSRQLHMEQGEAARPEGDPGRAWRR